MERDAERREGQRFPIQQRVVYRAAIGKKILAGCGETINMSSSGILFTLDHPLPKDIWVTIEVSWPVLLDNRKPIKLVTHGKVVRSLDGVVAVRIRDWEFRTVSSPGASGNSDPEETAGRGSAAHG